MAMTKAVSIRAMNRERINEAVLAAARDQIAASGANSLSMRAIARELGMASSAIYRYFESRDALLTKLIIDSYDSLGRAAESAEARISRDDPGGRFRAICHAVRRWALANRHEYFLIYGTPVPGYQAPQDTVGPATRVADLMIALLVESDMARPRLSQSVAATPATAALHRALAPIRAGVSNEISDAELASGLSVFSALFGAVSFELSGRLHNVIKDGEASRRAYFDSQIDGWLAVLSW